MRILPGHPQEFANQTPTSHELIKFMIAEPEILPMVMTLWRGEDTPFSSLLADRGLTSKGLFTGLENKNYRIVGSNQVMYRIQHSDRRKLRIVANAGRSSSTYVCTPYPTEPGKNNSIVEIFMDGNWFSPKDVLELKDNRTLIYVADDQLPQEVAAGVWRYVCKIVTKEKTAYINTDLLTEGDEVGFVYTMFEHDLSETAYEKYTFDGWGKAFMTLQRMKYSISGTAAAMQPGAKWVEHNGQKAWINYAQEQMLKRWSQAQEFANIWGKGTVNVEGDVLMRDTKGREIMAGDGIVNQGDGALKFPYNKWTKKFLHSIMKTMQLRAGSNGLTELVFIGGQEAIWGFNDLLIKEFGQRHILQSIGNGGDMQGLGQVSHTYKSYEINGVRIIPMHYKFFDSPDRPNWIREDGTLNSSWNGMFVSLGNAQSGEKGVEMITLRDRQFKTGSVSGIDKGGENMANSIDGSHHHILGQSGIILRNLDGVAEIYRP